MDVETILFDLDSTLCRYCRPPDSILSAAFDQAGVRQFCTAADLSAVAVDVPPVESDLEFHTRCLEAVAETHGADSDSAPAVARAYETEIDHFDVEFLPGAQAALADLTGYPLGLVTNGGRYTQQVKLASLGIRKRFESLVFATPEKGLKPDPYPFDRALGDLDADPETTIHVGDSLHADVAGANAMGIRSVWIPENARHAEIATDDPTPDHTLESLAELPALLE